jgi:hypothetical protein
MELCPAGRRADEVTVDPSRGVVVGGTEDAVAVPLPLLQQDSEQDRLT